MLKYLADFFDRLKFWNFLYWVVNISIVFFFFFFFFFFFLKKNQSFLVRWCLWYFLNRLRTWIIRCMSLDKNCTVVLNDGFKRIRYKFCTVFIYTNSTKHNWNWFHYMINWSEKALTWFNNIKSISVPIIVDKANIYKKEQYWPLFKF